MATRLAVLALCAVLIAGCTDRKKEETLQSQLAQTEKDRAAAQQLLNERDSYLEEVVKEVNAVYADLEQARRNENRLLNRAGGPEKAVSSASVDTRQKLLQDINEIGSALKESRKRIASLETRARESRRNIASLDSLVQNLKRTLLEREQSIAMLEGKVQGLEATVAENARTLAEKESVIDGQQKKMNTAYYVIGTRNELKKKGIITDEGGFLWGLLGSTTIMASGIDAGEFKPIDRTRDQTIHVLGKVDEILPRRQDNFFAMAETDDKNTDLTIVNPDKFWQDRYLVIVVD
jgi:hypothetical protein